MATKITAVARATHHSHHSTPERHSREATVREREEEPAWRRHSSVTAKEKPNYFPTGLLAAAANTVAQVDGSTITLKYHEPPEARKPSPHHHWRLYVFKGTDVVDTVDLGTRSCWLAGREGAVADLTTTHPSISKQHAVIQFRFIEKTDIYGDKAGRVRPYLIDLESANGTLLNDKSIPNSTYVELRPRDVIRFGNSTKEYVLMYQE